MEKAKPGKKSREKKKVNPKRGKRYWRKQMKKKFPEKIWELMKKKL